MILSRRPFGHVDIVRVWMRVDPECDEGVISSTIMRPHLRKIAPGAVLRWTSARVIIHFIIMSRNTDGKSGWPLPRFCDSFWLHVLIADKHIRYCLIGTYAVCDGFFASTFYSARNINRRWKRKVIDFKLLVSAKLFPNALLQLELHLRLSAPIFLQAFFLFHNKILITSCVYLNAIYYMLLIQWEFLFIRLANVCLAFILSIYSSFIILF